MTMVQIVVLTLIDFHWMRCAAVSLVTAHCGTRSWRSCVAVSLHMVAGYVRATVLGAPLSEHVRCACSHRACDCCGILKIDHIS